MLIDKIIYSAISKDKAINTTKDNLAFIKQNNKNIFVDINKTSLSKCQPWFIDDFGMICNQKKTFFQIFGIKQYQDNYEIRQQPIIIQNEIGFLGIICKEINGVLHFLMQAKIEPGNINKIQLSPTIQATKSNFMQKHGGKEPAYLSYFTNVDKYDIIVDQIQ